MRTSYLRQGAIAGLIAGLVFAAAQMLVALFQGASVFAPLYLIASIPLFTAPAALSGAGAALIGVVFHVILAVAFGIVGVYALQYSGRLKDTPGGVVMFATLYGLFLWAVNFYVFAPLLGAEWFATQTQPLIQALLHAVAYGTVFGMYLNRALFHRRVLAFSMR